MNALRALPHKIALDRRILMPALLLAGLVASTLLYPPATHAATCSWLGGTGTWDDVSKWSCGAVPGGLDSATIDSWGSTISLTSAVNVGSLTLKNGTLDGNYNLTITGVLNWSGGTIKGPGQLYLTAATTSTLSGQRYLDGRTLNNAGTVNTTGPQYFSNGAIWNNESSGTLDFQGDTVWQGNEGANGVLSNLGTVKKSAGNATLAIGKGPAGVTIAFSNASTVLVQSGTLQFDGGGASTGPVSVGDSATLRLAGPYDFNSGGDISGAGTVLFEPGPAKVVNLKSQYNIDAKTSISSGTLNIAAGAVITQIGTVLEIKNSATLATVVPIQVANSMVWTSGTFKGPGALTIGNGAQLTLSGSVTLDGTTLNNDGIATSSGTLAFYLNNAAVWNNSTYALLDLQGDGMIVGSQGLDSTFNNSGTIRKSAGVNTLRVGSAGYPAEMTLNNTGLIQALKGRLYISGPFNQFSGTTLSGGAYEVSSILAFNNANIVTNSAKIILDGANAQIQGGISTENGLANFANNAAGGQLIVRNGKSLTVPAAFANAGSVTIENASTFAVASGNYDQSGGTTKLMGGTLAPAGLVNINGGGLEGTGSVNSSVVNVGSVSPGNPTGTLTITGQYQQNNGGALNVELAGTGAGQYDQLNAAAAATLDGTLNVTRLNGFAPVTGDIFQIMSFGSASGVFATTNGLSLGNNLALGVQYNPDNVKLATGPAGLTLASLNPEGALAGSAGFTLTVNGTGFVAGSQVKWNDAARTTTFVDSTKVTAQILAADIQNAGTATVTISNPGGLTSDGLPFVIKAVAVPTTAVLHSSASPSVFGQSVTFTLDVTPGLPGGPAPTGVVTFYEVIGSAMNTSRRVITRTGEGAAPISFTFTTAALSPGLHTIGAAYSGDSYYSASVAVALKQTVNKADTVIDLTSSAPSTFYGEPVTFSAALSVLAPGGGIVSGNVSFRADGELIPGCEAQPVTSGVAKCMTYTLPVGFHLIHAVYGGSTEHQTSWDDLYPQHEVKAFTPIKIGGMVYHDSNLNGSRQLIEPGLGMRRVQLTNLATGVISTTVTSSGGAFNFTAGYGVYRIRPVLTAGWYQTSPNPADFTSVSGAKVGPIYIGEVKGADLSAAMTTSVPTAATGQTISYFLTVRNLEGMPVPAPIVSFYLPAKVRYLSVSGPAGSLCNTVFSIGVITSIKCAMALFGVGSKATFNFKVQVKAGTPSGTVLTGKGTIGSVLYDPDKTNNTATAAVTVQ